MVRWNCSYIRAASRCQRRMVRRGQGHGHDHGQWRFKVPAKMNQCCQCLTLFSFSPMQCLPLNLCKFGRAKLRFKILFLTTDIINVVVSCILNSPQIISYNRVLISAWSLLSLETRFSEGPAKNYSTLSCPWRFKIPR